MYPHLSEVRVHSCGHSWVWNKVHFWYSNIHPSEHEEKKKLEVERVKPAIWSLSGENILQTKQEKSIYVQVNVSNKRCNHFLKKLSREIFHPVVLLAPQSASPSICSVTNMYEHTCKCSHLSLSVAFRKCFCLMQALTLWVKTSHCSVLSILLHYLHVGFYSESHFVFFSFFPSIASNSNLCFAN